MYAPRSSAESAACVADALADGRPLEIVGGGTRCDFGAPRSADVAVLGTAGLSGIIAYDAAELVLTARAGTPLADLEMALAERGQAFLFEPGGAPRSTIGGVIGAAISGSRRVSGGAVRDHLLGFEAVSGRGKCSRRAARW